MLDKNVGDALLKLDLNPPTDPPVAQIERIIELDYRRVRRWTRIAIVLWILAALGAASIFVLGAITFPIIGKLADQKARAESAANASGEKDGEAAVNKGKNAESLDDLASPFAVLAKLVAMCMVIGTASFMVLVFAGIATVLLLIRSRTATLRQINANLLLISEQLKRTPPGAALGGT